MMTFTSLCLPLSPYVTLFINLFLIIIIIINLLLLQKRKTAT